MPDWLAHILFAYLVCKIVSLKFKSLGGEEIAVIFIGAIIPDLTKAKLIFGIAGMDIQDMIETIHTPAGSLLVIAFISIFFIDTRRVFLLLALGAGTHFLLDLMEKTLDGGILLLFPLSWERYSFDLIPNDDWRTGVLFGALILAGMIIHCIFMKLLIELKDAF